MIIRARSSRKMLTTLPPELLTEVVSYLNGPGRLRLRATCKSFEAAVANSNLSVRRRGMHIGKVSFEQPKSWGWGRDEVFFHFRLATL